MPYFAIIGGTLNLYHYYLLKKNSSNVSTPNTLIQKAGLYRYIRHPMYLGDFLILASLSLISIHIYSIALFIVGCIAIVVLTHFEDKYMEGFFKDSHLEWCQKTKKLIPFIY